MIEAGIRALLLADTGVSALVADSTRDPPGRGRVFPLMLPQTPASPLPAITYARVSGIRDTTLSGPVGLVKARLQVDCWASTFDGARGLAGAVRRALDGYRGWVSDVNPDDPADVTNHDVQGCFLLTERDLYEPDPKTFRVVQDYLVVATE